MDTRLAVCDNADALVPATRFGAIESGVSQRDAFLSANRLIRAAAPRIRRPSHRACLVHDDSVAEIERFRRHHFEYAAAESRRSRGIGRTAHDKELFSAPPHEHV